MGSLPCEILWTFLKLEKGRTPKDGPKNKEIIDNGQDFTPKR